MELADRYPEQVEAAVYFCCLEAIQNAGKHAGDGACVTVRVDTDGPLLRFSIRGEIPATPRATPVAGRSMS